jgi:hypothetical protein
MEIDGLATGDTLWLEDGSLVSVLAPSTNGETVKVRYVEAPFDASLIGSEADCSDYDIISFANESDIADSGLK